MTIPEIYRDSFENYLFERGLKNGSISTNLQRFDYILKRENDFTVHGFQKLILKLRRSGNSSECINKFVNLARLIGEWQKDPRYKEIKFSKKK